MVTHTRCSSPHGPLRAVPVSAALALVLGACSSPSSSIIVVVETDIGVPTPLAQIRASTGATAHDFALTAPDDLPFSFAIVPGDSDPTRLFDLVLDGRDGDGDVIVSRTVRTGFTPGRTTLLRVRLEASCLDRLVTCPPGTTCIGGMCASNVIPPEVLLVIVPGQELTLPDGGGVDAGLDVGAADAPGTDAPGLDAPGLDAPGLDAPGLDAPGLDAPTGDAGPLDSGVDGDASDVGPTDGGPPGTPRSCVEVRDAGGATGVHTIDPDGAGATAPFAVYCENTANGGGWTLIARVAGTSTLLRYDDTVWTGSVARAFGDPSTLTTGEALLASYWTLPVTELRMGMTDSAGTRWATATLARVTTLRGAMDIPGAVAIEGMDMPAWNALAGATFTSVCTTAGLGMSMVNARVRIGVLVAGAAPCGPSATAYAWVGFGAWNDTWSGCSRYDTASGGSQPCGGPPSFRFTHPAYGVLLAR